MDQPENNYEIEIEELKTRIHRLEVVIDVISARLADVQLHPALSIPPLPGFEDLHA